MGRAARTSISAASAATGFSGFPHAAAPARSPGCPALSASPPRGAAIPAGGSAAGLYRGGGEMEKQGQPTGAGEGGLRGKLQSAVLTAPLCALGARPEREAEARCPRRPQCGSSVPVADNCSSTQGRSGEWEPQVGHPREANWVPPPSRPLPPPRSRLLGVVRPGAAERRG